MGLLDKLKELIKVEINSPILNIQITNNSNNNFKNTEKLATINEKEQTIYINLEKLNREQKEKLGEIIKKEYLDDGNRLFVNDAAVLFDDLHRFTKDISNQQILKFFSQIIPAQDLEALEASLYLREIFQKNVEPKLIKKIKEDIRISFGTRGNNIANLCTAGYFEKFLMPLYNSAKENFKELYEVVVQKSVVAVFVHNQMKSEEIPAQIEEKLKISKKYGVDFIYIHGIGKSNIEKIKECLEKQKEFFGFFEKKVYESLGREIIIIELLLK